MTLLKYSSLKINKIAASSGFFIGTNIQKGRVNSTIQNEGFGHINGKKAKVRGNVGIVESEKTND
ncbi:hypothetical protein [Heyndrickxia vini]|uniref:Uncharacterized protein n=1 Tax=Heyndrickxia vini TaxID=1476025 RepID=A0ABX7DY94_9BACI|nr:hypothetical protein [Heyndrickxia vini]QQZ08453.1 hypothetical protein I5776_15465 [Heyndrickxia vini]